MRSLPYAGGAFLILGVLAVAGRSWSDGQPHSTPPRPPRAIPAKELRRGMKGLGGVPCFRGPWRSRSCSSDPKGRESMPPTTADCTPAAL
jgi:hypothetical protein